MTTATARIYRMSELATVTELDPVTERYVVIARGITGQSRAWIYKEIRAGRFPAPLRLGPKSSGWLSTEIHEWFAQRAAERNREMEGVARPIARAAVRKADAVKSVTSTMATGASSGTM